MTKVISFISRKGGSGKTTNAINLATSIHSMGKKVIVFETDPNFTLMASRKMEVFKGKLKEDKLFPIIPTNDIDVSVEIEKIYSLNKYDFIIVDKEDVLLIYPKSKEQDIKLIANKLMK